MIPASSSLVDFEGAQFSLEFTGKISETNIYFNDESCVLHRAHFSRLPKYLAHFFDLQPWF